MGSRLRDNNPLVPDEDARAQRLLELLHGRLGSLPRRQRQSLNRRLRRTLAKLNSGYPGQRPEVMGFALVDPGEDDIRQAALSERASQETVMKLKTELHEIYGELRLGPAVAAAAEQLGLQPADSHGLLDWRRSSWPISAFARPKRNNPALRFERA